MEQMKNTPELYSEANHHRKKERFQRWIGSMLVGAGGVMVALVAGEAAKVGLDGVQAGGPVLDALLLASGAWVLSSATSEGRQADTLQAELLRRESMELAVPQPQRIPEQQ